MSRADALLEIDVSGVILEKQDTAKTELHDAFSPIAERGVDIKILVTRDFDQIINDILREKSGYEHHYTSRHEKSIAAGKTFSHNKDGDIGFTVVFNAKILGGWENSHSIWRRLTFFHELVHITDGIRLFHEAGEACFVQSTTAESVMFDLSNRVWEEYHAVRASTEMIAKIPNIEIQEIERHTWIDDYTKIFVTLIETLPEFLIEKIIDFKIGNISIDELCQEVFPRIRETLISAAYVTAQLDALCKTIDIEELKEEKYSFFFERWKVIHLKLQSLYGLEQKFDKRILGELADELVLFYKRCGLSMRNDKNGIYVAVSIPAF